MNDKEMMIFKCNICNIKFGHEMTEKLDYAYCPSCAKKKHDNQEELIQAITAQRDCLLKAIDLKKTVEIYRNVEAQNASV
jgi:hypothetical protein